MNIIRCSIPAAVYQGQRSASDQKRVFILSRSAFAGSQTNSVTAWSGDINSDWFSFPPPDSCGPEFRVSGIPYWTTDIGGFVLAIPAIRRFGSCLSAGFSSGRSIRFCACTARANPDENELWSYGPDAQKILVDFDRLRYRLLPYIYSLAWKTTTRAYTPMRPLVMDFRTDRARAEYWRPVHVWSGISGESGDGAGGRRRAHVYLPQANGMTSGAGRQVEGGRVIEAAAPLDRLPLYIRAGSIVPMGPDDGVVHAEAGRSD